MLLISRTANIIGGMHYVEWLKWLKPVLICGALYIIGFCLYLVIRYNVSFVQG